MRLDVTSHTVRRSLGLQWIAANLFGFAFGGLLFGVVQGVRMQPYFEAVTSVREAVRIEAVNTGEALALFGALVGAAQWVVLRRTPVARWWVPATALGWGLSGVVVGVDSGLALGAMSSVGPHRGPVVTAAAAIASAVRWGSSSEGSSGWISGSTPTEHGDGRWRS
jgi:hypothetical protein